MSGYAANNPNAVNGGPYQGNSTPAAFSGLTPRTPGRPGSLLSGLSGNIKVGGSSPYQSGQPGPLPPITANDPRLPQAPTGFHNYLRMASNGSGYIGSALPNNLSEQNIFNHNFSAALAKQYLSDFSDAPENHGYTDFSNAFNNSQVRQAYADRTNFNLKTGTYNPGFIPWNVLGYAASSWQDPYSASRFGWALNSYNGPALQPGASNGPQGMYGIQTLY